jgi:cell division protein ZapA
MSASVAITIAGRDYEFSCDEGQEATLTALAGEIDRRATKLLKSVGPVSDARLLVMVALTLADDLNEAGKNPAEAATDPDADARISAGLDRLAARIESIADRIESA